MWRQGRGGRGGETGGEYYRVNEKCGHEGVRRTWRGAWVFTISLFELLLELKHSDMTKKIT